LENESCIENLMGQKFLKIFLLKKIEISVIFWSFLIFFNFSFALKAFNE